ncbi:MAG: hypothetical protein GY703_20720 [Gammaproteobacteria bacterium]|nr:hypothetical protein [Gammaproteobacteria bacterium]
MKPDRKVNGGPVFIIDGARTPFLRAKGKPGPFRASDLAIQCGRVLLGRQNFDPTELDEVILGCAAPGPEEANISRVVALRTGCGDHIPAWTVQRNCASGMQALDSAAQNILTGRSDLVLAGGTESMSHYPLMFNSGMVDWLSDWNRMDSSINTLSWTHWQNSNSGSTTLPKTRPGG